jgi:predicted nucleic acid-binding protein
MVLEALERGLTAGSSPARRLAQRPDLVRQLSKYYFATQKIPDMRIEAVQLPENFLAKSQEYRQTHGLLVNDSLVPMYMREMGVTLLASADSAFDRVPWIRRASPADI